MRIYTIGFTGKSARDFFGKLQGVEARYLLDVRLRNTSQLAGYTKKGNIEFLTEQLTGLTYVELPMLAPSKEMLERFQKDRDWSWYETEYLRLLKERKITREIDRALLRDGAVLLCSEPTAERCHRRLAAEYLKNELFPDAYIVHL